ncbi:MAG: LPS export ABC transporter periplasmic protein LptC [Alphaproteobacteria bacterium]|nr:LPS export ABC transporter periplasmic protein LptC [Alphaproteobacteria bacterium]
MLDPHQLDNYFNTSSQATSKNKLPESCYSRFVKLAKLALPSTAAVLVAVLLIFPSLKDNSKDFRLDITRPKKGELEKLHVENTVFYITDKDNKVNNFVAQNIDETSPGSKLVKLTKPEGIIPQDNQKWINIKAPLGFFNQNNNLLELQENIEIFYSEGMNISTTSAFFDFNKSHSYGQKPVIGQGFLGKIKATGFNYYSDNKILTFTGPAHITINEESIKK